MDKRITKEEPIQKTEAPKQQYYTVKIEAMVPCTMTFKILATSPQEAITKARKTKPHNIIHQLNGRRDLKASVYKFGYSIIELVMNLIGK